MVEGICFVDMVIYAPVMNGTWKVRVFVGICTKKVCHVFLVVSITCLAVVFACYK